MQNDEWKGEHLIKGVRYTCFQKDGDKYETVPKSKKHRELPRSAVKEIPGYLNIYDVADRYGLASKHVVHRYRGDGRFPVTPTRIHGRFWWKLEDLEKWEELAGIKVYSSTQNSS